MSKFQGVIFRKDNEVNFVVGTKKEVVGNLLAFNVCAGGSILSAIYKDCKPIFYSQTGAYFKNQTEVNNLVNKGSRLLKEHYQYNY